MGARLHNSPKQHKIAASDGRGDRLPSPNGSNWLGTSRPSRVDIPSNGELRCFGVSEANQLVIRENATTLDHLTQHVSPCVRMSCATALARLRHGGPDA